MVNNPETSLACQFYLETAEKLFKQNGPFLVKARKKVCVPQQKLSMLSVSVSIQLDKKIDIGFQLGLAFLLNL